MVNYQIASTCFVVADALTNLIIYFAGCDGPDVIPTYADVCASFQFAVVSHLCKKIQRGMIYADMKHLIPDGNRVLVQTNLF